ncbi:hypothetical protein COCON_G00144190 [Conger conger]|uniref:Uncharacterized protein n=1 Tax=Conger conger TaxID=82655 RepID=A0A9Q1DBX2_CONCO|nr:hypothetical protein COCON_G00144190 [Conger conger]
METVAAILVRGREEGNPPMLSVSKKCLKTWLNVTIFVGIGLLQTSQGKNRAIVGDLVICQHKKKITLSWGHGKQW